MRSSLIVVFSLIILAALVASCSTESEPVVEPIEFEAGSLVAAQKCGNCHTDIYTFWKSSAHATALKNENFQIALNEAVEAEGDDARRLCLTCHAPAVIVNGDYELTEEVTREGVNCDFCHSLTDTDPSQEDPFVLEVSDVKYGPVKDAASTGHKVAYSEFHTESRHCAGCHEFKNEAGISVLSTYSEWEEYQSNGGNETCQGCHMPLVLANVVDPKVKRVNHSFVNLHSMPGGHSKDQLTKSIRMKIMEIAKTDEGLLVQVNLNNRGAGHYVPTGTPSRKIILGVEVIPEEGETRSQEKIYQKRVANAEGNPITMDAFLFMQAASVIEDNRLKPGIEHVEEFLFPGVGNENLQVKATLTYAHSPHNSPETETRVEFFSETKNLMTSWKR